MEQGKLALALLLSLLPAAALGSAAWEAKSVHGYKIALAVETIPEPAAPGSDTRHVPALEHRLLVSVREEASGKAAPIASVSANVAESGYAGEMVVGFVLLVWDLLTAGRRETRVIQSLSPA